MFYSTGPWGLYHKTFDGRNKFHSVISYCVCYYWSLFIGFNKHTRFLCYRIAFMIQAPVVSIIKYFFAGENPE